MKFLTVADVCKTHPRWRIASVPISGCIINADGSAVSGGYLFCAQRLACADAGGGAFGFMRAMLRCRGREPMFDATVVVRAEFVTVGFTEMVNQIEECERGSP